MLSENIQKYRKLNNMSQQELAEKVHVVRQTVSKWEKGQSVPDADLLAPIAKALDVQVSDLLDDCFEKQSTMENLLLEVALLNERLSNHYKRSRRVKKAVIIVCGSILGLIALLVISSYMFFSVVEEGDWNHTHLVCTLDGKTYEYTIEYDDSNHILTSGGDAFISSHVDVGQYEDAQVLIAQIEDYFEDRNGTVTVEQDVKTAPTAD